MSTRILLLSDWRNGYDADPEKDKKHVFESGTKLELDDDTATELISLGAARPLTDDENKDPEYVPTSPTASTVVGQGGQTNVQQPTPQITPAPAPTQEQIAEDLRNAGIGS